MKIEIWVINFEGQNGRKDGEKVSVMSRHLNWTLDVWRHWPSRNNKQWKSRVFNISSRKWYWICRKGSDLTGDCCSGSLSSTSSCCYINSRPICHMVFCITFLITLAFLLFISNLWSTLSPANSLKSVSVSVSVTPLFVTLHWVSSANKIKVKLEWETIFIGHWTYVLWTT